MTSDRHELYARRFEQVFAWIEQHLDSPLTVEQLSEVACFRVFIFTGNSASFVESALAVTSL